MFTSAFLSLFLSFSAMGERFHLTWQVFASAALSILHTLKHTDWLGRRLIKGGKMSEFGVLKKEEREGRSFFRLCCCHCYFCWDAAHQPKQLQELMPALSPASSLGKWAFFFSLQAPLYSGVPFQWALIDRVRMMMMAVVTLFPFYFYLKLTLRLASPVVATYTATTYPSCSVRGILLIQFAYSIPFLHW